MGNIVSNKNNECNEVKHPLTNNPCPKDFPHLGAEFGRLYCYKKIKNTADNKFCSYKGDMDPLEGYTWGGNNPGFFDSTISDCPKN